MHVLAIIPARYGSTRLPGKPLIKLKGKTIIERVYQRVAMCNLVDEIVVATDDIRIFNHVKKFGGNAMITRIDHQSGTSRCAEVLHRYAGATHVINVQGDEPLIYPKQIDDLVRFITNNPEIGIGTLVKRIENIEDLENPAKVKVVRRRDGQALYFSRSAIPYVRDAMPDQWLEHAPFFKHIGMYAFKSETLMHLSLLDQDDLEKAEKLEQLNWLAHGYPIHTLETEYESIGVDTREDANLVEHILSLETAS